MDLDALVPGLLLAASFAAGLSGLLVHAQIPHDPAQPLPKSGNANFGYRHIANALFALAIIMLAWGAIFAAGHQATRMIGEAETTLHRILMVGTATIAAVVGYWRKRQKRAQKPNDS
ncbi:MAG: hypothetical protein ACREPN_01905 [Rudaea sp.]